MLEAPTPETVFSELSFLFPIVNEALDYGIHKTRDFFDGQERIESRNINSYLAPNLVRFYAREKLGVIEDNRFTLENVANNGIHLCHERYSIRVLKSSYERLPIPGHSISRQRFYSQSGVLDFQNDNSCLDYTWNLLLLWNVRSGYILGGLSLACPRAGARTRESVLAHWHCAIPERYILGGFAIDISESPEIQDLPLELNIDESEIENVK